MKYQVFGILWTVFNLALMLVMGIVGIYLLWLVIKALRVYINSHEVREEKKATRKSLAEALRENRVRCKMTQEFVSETIGVSRQAVSKWENGKSVPDQASLILLYQYLDIKDNEKKQLSKLIFNKQNIILILIAILFSPMVIGVRFICCKIDKIENRKIKAVIKVIGFVVFSSYLVSLKENVAYLLIGIFSLVYLLYQFYLSGLETK